MDISAQEFVRMARTHFDYLSKDFGFTVQERTCQGAIQRGAVEYDSARVSLRPYLNSRDGIGLLIHAKADTFWIRPACSHTYDVEELVMLLAPGIAEDAPKCSWPNETKSEVEAWLRFYAQQLRAHAEPLLRGDLGLCEDILITRYCRSSKGLPMDDYFKVFREACAMLPATDRERMEAAMAARSPRQLYFLLHEWVQAGRLRGGPLLTTLHDFWVQYFS